MCICKRTTPLYCSGQTLSVGRFCILYSLCILYNLCKTALSVTVAIIHFNGEQSPTLPLPSGGSGSPFNTRFFGPTRPPECTTQTASRSIQPFLWGSPLCPTDRQRQTQTTLLGYIDSNRPHFCTLRMRRGLIILIKVVWYVDRASLPSIGAEEEPGREGTTSER